MARRAIDSERDEARRTAALMGFAVILVLAIAGVVLVRELREKGRLEDCLMQGRRNCAPIETPLKPAAMTIRAPGVSATSSRHV